MIFHNQLWSQTFFDLQHDADAKSERDFNLEASVMAQFDNPNVVRMEGVVTKCE